MSATLALLPETHNLQPVFPTLPETSSVAQFRDIKDWCLACADEWYAQGQHAIACDFLDHATCVDPKDPSVWLALGSLEYERGNFEKAGRAFHKAGALIPTDTRVFLHLGLVHQKLGHNGDAEAMFKHSLALNSENKLAMNLLGIFLMEQNRHAEARPYFARILARQQDDIEVLLRLAVCCFKSKNEDVARTCYERVLHLCPGHPLALENLQAMKTLAMAR
jgi:Flp pilus assembly protein TadD